ESESEGDESESEGDESESGNGSKDAGELTTILSNMENDDLSKGVGESIAQEVVNTAKTSQYVNFTDEYDKVKLLEERMWSSEHEAKKFEDTVSHMTAPVQKDIERAICAKSISTWANGHRRGKLHGSSLSRLTTGDDRVFRKKIVNKSKDVAISLVIDCSGSMSGSRITLACQAALTLSMVLDRLRINHEVCGFTTETMPQEAHDKMYQDQKTHGVKYARMVSVVMPIFKLFGKNLDMPTKRRITGMVTNGYASAIMNSNCDGESIAMAAKRLASQKEARKIMIVLSDGMPACWGSADFNKHLRDTVKSLEKSGMDVVGIGINSRCVESFYSKSIYVDDVNALPTVVAKQLKSMLIAGANK
ncbi:MAG: VWA domain-containing protein, partial [Methylomicrobium sp.]|nr:VWA domain-containing protein [Methylomicrobium sp.]